MHARPRAERRWPLVVVAGTALVLGGTSGADGTTTGSARADAGASLAVTVATWRAAPAAPGEPHMGAALPLSWVSASGGLAVATFEVANVGRLDLTDQRIVVRATTTGGGAPRDPIVLTACSGGVWDPTGASCPGTTVELGTGPGSPLATGMSLRPGERLSMRAATRQRTASQTLVEVDVVVSRADVRPMTMTSG